MSEAVSKGQNSNSGSNRPPNSPSRGRNESANTHIGLVNAKNNKIISSAKEDDDDVLMPSATLQFGQNPDFS